MVDQLNPATSHPTPSQSRRLPPSDPFTASDMRSPANSSGSWLKRSSLRQKVTAIAIVLGTLPVLGVGAVSYVLADKTITEQVASNQQQEATRLSDLVSRYMAQRYADVQSIANLPILNDPKMRDGMNPAEQDAAFDRVAQAYATYSSISVFDVEGNAQFQTGQRPIPNQASQAYFRDTLRANRATISQPVLTGDSKTFEVYITSPVKDIQSGKTIAVVRAALPLEKLAEQLQSYTERQEYSLIDASNQVVLASKQNRVGQKAEVNFPEFSQMQALQKTNSRFLVDPRSGDQLFLSFHPWTRVEGLPNLDWRIMLGSNSQVAFQSRQKLLMILGLGTVAAALVIGTIAAFLARRLTRRIESVSKAVQNIGQGQLETRLRVRGNDEISLLGSNINHMAAQLQTSLQEQIQNTQNLERLNEATFNIRKTLDFNVILQTGVYEARRLLNVDRAVVYLFDKNWQGRVVAESVALDYPAALGAYMSDPCFAEKFAEKYRQGRIHMIADVDSANLDPCYREQLDQFQVKANLVSPLVVDGELVGLFVLHYCSGPHQWESSEINLFCQLAVHLGNALEQVTLVQQRQKVSQTEALAEERRQQKEGLQQQLVELLDHVEKVAMGDLTVRANVTAGEIGTVADFFNAIVENLQHIVSQVKQAAVQVNTSLGEHEAAVRVLAQEALQQAEETTSTLGAVEQMVQSIEAVAQSAKKAADVSHTASATAESGGMAMDLTVQQILGLRQTIGETTKKVKRLGESSQQISKIVSLINQIAVQTNLLAINAGIEAARAGEDSQGFASIAEEVGALAARASEATREIEQLVADIQRETSDVVIAMEQGTTQVVEGTRFVENAKHSLEQIVLVSYQIDQLVQSISEATVSQVETSHVITNLMQAVAQVSGRTSDSSVEVSNSLRQTIEIARELRESVETFKVS